MGVMHDVIFLVLKQAVSSVFVVLSGRFQANAVNLTYKSLQFKALLGDSRTQIIIINSSEILQKNAICNTSSDF